MAVLLRSSPLYMIVTLDLSGMKHINNKLSFEDWHLVIDACASARLEVNCAYTCESKEPLDPDRVY